LCRAVITSSPDYKNILNVLVTWHHGIEEEVFDLCILKPAMTKLLVAFHSFANVSTNSQLRLCREVIAVCSEIHKKYRIIIRENNVEFLSVEPGGAQSNQ
jgi:hypothetical protein